MISADDFLKENYQKQGKGKLLKFKNDILKLRNAGLSFSKICEFLNQNKISVSEEAVRRFCKRHLANYEPSHITLEPEPAKKEPIETNKKTIEIVKPETNEAIKPSQYKSIIEPQKSITASSSIKKFKMVDINDDNIDQYV